MERLLKLDQYETKITRSQATAISALTMVASVMYLVFLFATRRFAGLGTGTVWDFSIPVFYLLVFFILFSIRQGWLGLAEYALPLLVYIGAVLESTLNGMQYADDGLSLAVFVIISGLARRERGAALALVVAIFSLIFGISLRPNLATPAAGGTDIIQDLAKVSLELVAISILVIGMLRVSLLTREEGVTSVQVKRALMAEITTRITRQISHKQSLQETMDNAADLIAASFPDIYHAQVFLMNEPGTQAELLASTGEVGKLLKQRRHSLKVGGRSVIGQVTGTRQVVVAYADTPDTIHRHNDLLPNTAVEAAFPLRVGERLIGALDLQSRNPGAFTDDDIPAFQALADHIAIALDNARLFDEAEETIRQNRQLIEESHASTQEVLRLNRQLTRQTWADHLRGKTDDLAVNIDFGKNTKEQGGAWTHTLREALQSNHTIHQRDDGRQIVAVPVRVRGEVIGAMEFELDESGQLAPEDILMVEEISEQLGLAAENTRLYENTQRSAHREALVNQIAARIQETNQVDATLAVAARNLQEVLKAERVAIRLGTPPAMSPNQSGGGE